MKEIFWLYHEKIYNINIWLFRTEKTNINKSNQNINEKPITII